MDLRSSRLFLALAAFLLVPSLSFAQATRTWVSGVGDDVNPCSRTAPCKTFAGAISKTAAKGEISVLDPGGFGAVTITKSITIVADGDLGSILASGTNGIVVNAAATDTVVLRGLHIEGAGTGLNGIRFIAGGALLVENCTIRGFTQRGIDFQPSGAAQLYVRNTSIFGAGGGGIFVKPSGAGSVNGSIDGSQIGRSSFGVHVEGVANIAVSNTVATANSSNGFEALNTSGAVGLSISRSSSISNGVGGVLADGAGTIVRITDSTIFANVTGLAVANSGQIISIGDVRNNGNVTNGMPTSTFAPQ